MYLPEEETTMLTNVCENLLKEKRLSLRQMTSLVVPVLSSQEVLPSTSSMTFISNPANSDFKREFNPQGETTTKSSIMEGTKTVMQ